MATNESNDDQLIERPNSLDNEHLIEEYKTLRVEIIQNSQEALKILEFGLGITIVLITFAFTGFIDEFRWLYLFTPCLVLFPIISLIAQRTRASNIIEEYIAVQLEPKLGFGWKKHRQSNREGGERRKRRKTMRYIKAITYPFIIIQILAIFLSLMEIYRFGFDLQIGPLKFIIWLCLFIVSVVFIYLEYQAIKEVLQIEKV